MTFWMILGCMMILLIAFFARSFYERHHLSTTHYVITSEKLPEDFDYKRIVFLTDLHNASFGENNEDLVKRVADLKPDYILFGGDMIIAHQKKCESFAPLETLLKGLKDIAPIYYGFGNHEGRLKYEEKDYPNKLEEFEKLLAKYQVIPLSNGQIRLQNGQNFVTIADVDYSRQEYKAVHKAPLPEGYVADRIGKRNEDYLIMLSHSPLYMEEMASYGADLILSGHFHGGTIRLPLLGGVMTPQYQFFHPYCKGLFHFGKTIGIVSGGLGTHTINIRFLNQPEVVCITLLKEETHGN